MRKYLFRAKRTDNGQWVKTKCVTSSTFVDGDVRWYAGAGQPGEFTFNKYGNILEAVTTGECLFYDVDPETVGQFTGLTDKNGRKIFEGDVVAYYWYEAEPMSFRVDFVSGEFLAVPVKKREDVWAIRISGQGENLEVIGNIHDNPELLVVDND